MTGTTDLPTLLEGFRLYCLAEGKRPTTIPWYMGKLRIFLRYLRTEDLPFDATELTTTDLRAFLVHLKQNVNADDNNPMKPARERPLAQDHTGLCSYPESVLLMALSRGLHR